VDQTSDRYVVNRQGPTRLKTENVTPVPRIFEGLLDDENRTQNLRPKRSIGHQPEE
jgi:hypothetical protein